MDGLSKNELEYNLGLSILEFLRYVKMSKPAVASELVSFTQGFGGVHAHKTIDSLIQECQKSVQAIKAGTNGAKATEAGWGVDDTANRDKPFLGLRHWVYINEAGQMYNWGTTTDMGNSAARPYEKAEHNYLVHVLRLG